MHNAVSELPRILLPRTRVNKVVAHCASQLARLLRVSSCVRRGLDVRGRRERLPLPVASCNDLPPILATDVSSGRRTGRHRGVDNPIRNLVEGLPLLRGRNIIAR
jgi:hypothetical protein